MKIMSYLLVFLTGLGLGLWFGKESNQSTEKKTETAQNKIDDTITAATTATSSNRGKNELSVVRVSSDASPSQIIKFDDLLFLQDKFAQIFNEQKFSEAAALLDQMEQKWPKSFQYLEGRSRLLVRTRGWERAKQLLKQCRSLFPQSKSCLIDLASTELQIGSINEQQLAILDCTSQFPIDPQCRNMLAILRMNQGKYSEAVSIYQQMIKDNGSYGFRFDEGMLNWQLGLALEGAGQNDEAEIYFQKACQSNWPGSCEKLHFSR